MTSLFSSQTLSNWGKKLVSSAQRAAGALDNCRASDCAAGVLLKQQIIIHEAKDWLCGWIKESMSKIDKMREEERQSESQIWTQAEQQEKEMRLSE
ncbi:MAG: hypothetical protein EZS28_006881 [Streblomastix strix]|uniref:Uncharacterized protein n=1 Tax=Streblomastix strix TaxID=222440 RepID=A0A5J4WTY7_9EUKA|nr:MAG: hypothetical protein EZS28_006881 [Streblomastix strix]